MKKPTRRTIAVAALALIVIAGFARVVATQGPLAPVKVTVTRVQETAMDLSVFGIGTVEARRSYNIGPTAAGRVAKVLVDHGDSVANGQLLAEMDPVDLDERLLAGHATFERAGQLARAAEASLAEVGSRARVAQANAERYADLRRRNFVSQEAVDARNHEYAAARAGVAAAEAALAAARDETHRAEADRAGTSKARAQLHLVSPVNGIVAARLAEPGTTLVAGQSVLQLVDPASLWVRTRIDQSRSAGLVPGLPVDVALRSRPDRPLQGHIERVELVGDAVTEERIVDVVFENMPAGLILGELAEVNIRQPAIDKALAIPAAAIRRVGKAKGVWLLQDGRTAFCAVTTGASTQDGLVQVVSGLAGTDEIVVYSSSALAPGLRVKVVDSLMRGGS